jgi:hypothetical protein
MATINDVLSLSLVLFSPITNPLVLDKVLSLRLGIAQLKKYWIVAQLSLSQFEIVSTQTQPTAQFNRVRG